MATAFPPVDYDADRLTFRDTDPRFGGFGYGNVFAFGHRHRGFRGGFGDLDRREPHRGYGNYRRGLDDDYFG